MLPEVDAHLLCIRPVTGDQRGCLVIGPDSRVSYTFQAGYAGSIRCRPLSASLRRPRELRQHVLTSGGPFAPEALHFPETECRVKVK
jgi:hypothetical protein